MGLQVRVGGHGWGLLCKACSLSAVKTRAGLPLNILEWHVIRLYCPANQHAVSCADSSLFYVAPNSYIQVHCLRQGQSRKGRGSVVQAGQEPERAWPDTSKAQAFERLCPSSISRSAAAPVHNSADELGMYNQRFRCWCCTCIVIACVPETKHLESADRVPPATSACKTCIRHCKVCHTARTVIT